MSKEKRLFIIISLAISLSGNAWANGHESHAPAAHEPAPTEHASADHHEASQNTHETHTAPAKPSLLENLIHYLFGNLDSKLDHMRNLDEN